MDQSIRCDCIKCTAETGRSPGCHGTCDRYKRYREKLELANKNRRMEKEQNMDCFRAFKRRHK